MLFATLNAFAQEQEGFKKIDVNNWTNSVPFDQVKLITNPVTYTEGNTIPMSSAYDQGLYVGRVRIAHSTDQNVPNNYNEWQQKLSSGQNGFTEGDFDGYTFVFNRRNNYVDANNTGDPKTANASTIRVRQADPTEYRVKLDTGGETVDFPSGYNLYAKVKIQYSQNSLGFGYARISDTPDTDGNYYSDIITQWYPGGSWDGDPHIGNPVTEIISGHEQNMSVTLHAVPSNVEVTSP